MWVIHPFTFFHLIGESTPFTPSVNWWMTAKVQRIAISTRHARQRTALPHNLLVPVPYISRSWSALKYCTHLQISDADGEGYWRLDRRAGPVG